MSEEEKVLETSTQEENQEEVSEDTEQDEFANLSEEELREKARKLKETADNYRLEIETKGLRKKERKIETPVEVEEETKVEVEPQQIGTIKTDYLSKRQDVLDEFNEDFSSLDDNEWNKIKDLITPALDNVYSSATKDKRFVAKGELARKVKDLVEYAKSGKQSKQDLEKARIKGVIEREQAEDAEVPGLRAKVKAKGSYTDEVKQLAESKGWDLKTADEILKKRKERDSEYAVKRLI